MSTSLLPLLIALIVEAMVTLARQRNGHPCFRVAIVLPRYQRSDVRTARGDQSFPV